MSNLTTAIPPITISSKFKPGIENSGKENNENEVRTATPMVNKENCHHHFRFIFTGDGD
jgi:hypothetical protein